MQQARWVWAAFGLGLWGLLQLEGPAGVPIYSVAHTHTGAR